MRVVVVDDQPSQRAGRVLWLSRVPGVDVRGVTFEEAAALGVAWETVDVAVLDGHDRRPAGRRLDAAREAGVEALPAHDNFPGARIAALVREHSPPDRTRIVMISAYARDSEVRARRIAQSGVDYVFEHYEVDHDEAVFVRAVLQPWTFSPRPEAADAPDVAAAVAAVEESPAGEMLLNDGMYKHHRELEWAMRTLRRRLDGLLGEAPLPSGGPRARRVPRKAWLAQQLREAFGRDLPTDPDAGQPPPAPVP